MDPATGTRRYAFGYDDQSNVSAISSYDASGTSLTATLCLRHDPLSRLTLVGLAAPGAGGPDAQACRSDAEVVTPVARFQYDARNRRVARWSAGTGTWTQFVLGPDGRHLAELERPASAGGAWSVLREYVWLEGRPLAQVEYPGPGGAEGHVYAIHADAIGLPRALTNRAGVVVWRAEARPYGDIGEVTTVDPASGRTVVTNLRLPGQYDERLLSAIGLQGPYYNWNRWYLPSVGRYLELDPCAYPVGSTRPGFVASVDAPPDLSEVALRAPAALP